MTLQPWIWPAPLREGSGKVWSIHGLSSESPSRIFFFFYFYGMSRGAGLTPALPQPCAGGCPALTSVFSSPRLWEVAEPEQHRWRGRIRGVPLQLPPLPRPLHPLKGPGCALRVPPVPTTPPLRCPELGHLHLHPPGAGSDPPQLPLPWLQDLKRLHRACLVSVSTDSPWRRCWGTFPPPQNLIHPK